jgi:hypothetical protein
MAKDNAKMPHPAELVDAMAAMVGQGDDSNVSSETREYVKELFQKAAEASSSSSEEKGYSSSQKPYAQELVLDDWWIRPPCNVRMGLAKKREQQEQQELQEKLSAISITEQQDVTQDQDVQTSGSSEEEA